MKNKEKSWFIRRDVAEPCLLQLVVTDKLIQEQPELVEAIIKVHIKATDYINAHQKRAAEIYAKKTKGNLTEIEHP